MMGLWKDLSTFSSPFSFSFEKSVSTGKAFGPAYVGGVLTVDFEIGIYGFLILLLTGWTSMDDDSCAPVGFEDTRRSPRIHGATS
jgi:hypothetical protein